MRPLSNFDRFIVNLVPWFDGISEVNDNTKVECLIFYKTKSAFAPVMLLS